MRTMLVSGCGRRRSWIGVRRTLRALAIIVVLCACAAPSGVPVDECDPSWEPRVTQEARGFTDRPREVAVDCWRTLGETTLGIGFVMPAGPDCRHVDRVDLHEDGAAVVVTIRIGRIGNELSGACPEEPLRWMVPVDLREPLGGRQVLDGSTSAR